MTVYRLGSDATPVAHFRLNGQPYDPAQMVLTIHKPRTPAPVVRHKGDATMFNDSVNDYATDLTFDERGSWRLVWAGTGTYTDGQGRTRPYAQTIRQVLRVYA